MRGRNGKYKVPPTVPAGPPTKHEPQTYTIAAFVVMLVSALYLTQFAPLAMLLGAGAYYLAMRAKREETPTKLYGAAVVGAALTVLIGFLVTAVYSLLLFGNLMRALIP